MASASIPVLIVTGFLGSGKTTLLNALLGQREMSGTLAIINEFGEIGLDHLLLEVTSERLALLDNGCVCCTVRDDLVETLVDLDKHRGTPDLPQIDRVILETTGLADPAPILHALMAQPDLESRYHIEGVITVVDAVNGAPTLAAHEEARKQLAAADRIVLSKSDLADSIQRTSTRAAIADINPSARLLVHEHGAVPASDILGSGFFTRDAASDGYARWMADVTRMVDHHGHDCADPDCDHDHHHHSGRHGDISTYAFVIDKPLDWGAFRQWLDYLAALKGADLLRMKGLVHIAQDPERPMVLHGVQHVFHRPRQLERWPSSDHRTRLVFIVKNIPRETIERTLIKFAAVDPGQVRGVAVA